MSKPEPSLRSRAVAILARREHSRAELARKLAPHAESREEVEAVLDELAERRAPGREVECLRRQDGDAGKRGVKQSDPSASDQTPCRH